jgi:hypothetical protein
VAPYSPALQFAHELDDCKLNCPALHWSAIDDVEPGGHTYPAVQFPEHDDVVRPDVAPYFPASHGPEQLAVVRPGVAPYSPALQLLHTPAPATLKVPAGHMTAVADTDPVAHAYPGVHSPEQLADGRPAEPPYVPAGQLEHTPDPDVANLPTGHCDAVDDTEPATHACPAEHNPLHTAADKPVLPPNVPAGHGAVQEEFVSPAVDPY